ncbi:flagellar biosynthesis anti-sigma factor FlgM [Enterococcus sp. LJL98]
MKINQNYGKYQKEMYPQVPNHELAKAKATEKHSDTPTVKLSETAQKIRQTNTNETKNAQKIAEIKKAIQEGTYQVSAKEIAENMWRGMKEK